MGLNLEEHDAQLLATLVVFRCSMFGGLQISLFFILVISALSLITNYATLLSSLSSRTRSAGSAAGGLGEFG